MSSVEEQVINIVSEQLGVEKKNIKRESNFERVGTVELVMELEEEFDISIPEDAAEKIQTVGEAIDHIEKSRASA